MIKRRHCSRKCRGPFAAGCGAGGAPAVPGARAGRDGVDGDCDNCAVGVNHRQAPSRRGEHGSGDRSGSEGTVGRRWGSGLTLRALGLALALSES